MAQPTKIRSDDLLFTADDENINEFDPSITALATGKFLITFTEEADAVGSHLNATHVSLSFGGSGGGNRIAQQTPIDELQASGAGLGAGSMLAFTWTERVQATDEYNIYARVITNGQATVLPRFLVNVGLTTGAQDRPEIVALGDENFAVSWVDRNTNKISYAVYSLGGTLVAPGALSTSNAGGPATARISMAAFDSSYFVVAYVTDSFDAKFRIASRFPGIAPEAEVDIDGTSGGNGAVSVAALSQSSFVTVYESIGGIRGRVFDFDNIAHTVTARTPVFNISTAPITGDPPQVAALDDGQFIVVYNQSDDIFARVMNADGSADSAAFRVNDVTTGFQGRPDVSVMANGTVVIAWETNEAGTLDVKYTVLDPREGPVFLIGTGAADDLVGTVFGDTLAGGAGQDELTGRGGDDRLDGGSGSDQMRGGFGNDRYFVDNVFDFISEEANEGTADEVVTEIDFSLTADVANVENLSVNASLGFVGLTLTGSEFVNVIAGGRGNDTINGAGGNDLLGGGDGNDTIGGGNGNDRLNGGSGFDTLAGGPGNDTYFTNVIGETITETGDIALGGDDLVVFSGATGTFVLGANVERLTLTGTGTTNGTGNALINTITGNSGRNVLDGGALKDVLRGLGGSDTYFVDSTKDRVIEVSGTAAGTADHVKFTGLANQNYSLAANVELLTLLGSATSRGTGNVLGNTIIGNGAANLLDGKLGKDTLIGGLGRDSFLFTTAPSAANFDRIADFKVVDDFIKLENTIFRAFGARVDAAEFVKNATGQAVDGNDFLIYETDTGELYYDRNGSAAGGSVLVAILSKNLSLTIGDFAMI